MSVKEFEELSEFNCLGKPSEHAGRAGACVELEDARPTFFEIVSQTLDRAYADIKGERDGRIKARVVELREGFKKACSPEVAQTMPIPSLASLMSTNMHRPTPITSTS